ncbi:hypothetical protein OIE67_02945 [Nonomuraea fuscirosea]|uniref:hypothetical protein n=1 Tax=Nonomuraea fuscirosea TaxID=1291556 RepID=UPI002DD9CE47|nr:hypothetical protein [Nonomuraea fuscirosea]WSA53612.1 hypothetical protein OIE67_02945 [Nonomuraea fuscirosea]
MWPLQATPGSKRDRLEACERLRLEAPVLRRMTASYLRWLLKPFFDAGATVRDVPHGLDVRPDDSRWTYTWSSSEETRHVPGWVRHRLTAWIGQDGVPAGKKVSPLEWMRTAVVVVVSRRTVTMPTSCPGTPTTGAVTTPPTRRRVFSSTTPARSSPTGFPNGTELLQLRQAQGLVELTGGLGSWTSPIGVPGQGIGTFPFRS